MCAISQATKSSYNSDARKVQCHLPLKNHNTEIAEPIYIRVPKACSHSEPQRTHPRQSISLGVLIPWHPTKADLYPILHLQQPNLLMQIPECPPIHHRFPKHSREPIPHPRKDIMTHSLLKVGTFVQVIYWTDGLPSRYLFNTWCNASPDS